MRVVVDLSGSFASDENDAPVLGKGIVTQVLPLRVVVEWLDFAVPKENFETPEPYNNSGSKSQSGSQEVLDIWVHLDALSDQLLNYWMNERLHLLAHFSL